MKSSFDSLSENYDSLWFFSNDYESWMDSKILSFLDLSEESRLVDLGGGTGIVTARLVEKSPVDHATCIEPSIEMLGQAKKYPFLICENLDAESFSNKKSGYTHILIKEAIHHINQRDRFWRKLKENNPGATVLVVTRPARPGFLLFDAAYKAFEQSQPSVDVLLEEASGSGFDAQVFVESWPVDMEKERWFEMMRSRFISDLFKFSDIEIENGISEINKTLRSDRVRFDDNLIFMSLN